MISDKQQIIERSVCAIASYDAEIICDPNLRLDLFTIPQYQEIIRVCKQVVSRKGCLATEDIVTELCRLGLDSVYFNLMEASFEKSRYESYLDQLQTSWMIQRAHDLLDSVNCEEITFDEYQTKVNKLGNDFSLGTSSQWSAARIMDEIQTIEEKLNFRKMAFYQEVVNPSKQTVNVIAARTGVGKSAFALNIANDLADKYKILYFNLEMTEKEIYQRLMAIESGVPIHNFQYLKDVQLNKLQYAAERFERLDMKIYNGSKSVDGIRKIVARECRKEHCVVFIDHIGYIINKKLTNTRERVQQTMIDLNNLSKDFNCTIFALSQLNRDADENPKLTNLKDSGEVEQTAHSIVLLNDLTKDFSDGTPLYELICAKNRGKTGRREAVFNKQNQQFQNARGGLIV